MSNILDKDIKINCNFLLPNKPNYKECINYFKIYLSHFNTFTDKELANISNYWEFFFQRKGEAITEPGTISKYLKFIVVGTVKYYSENNNGKHIIGFLTETNFCTPIKGFIHQLPSADGAICVEDTYGLKINHSNYIKLLADFPVFDKFFSSLYAELIVYLENY